MIGNLIGVAISESENSCFVGVQVNEYYNIHMVAMVSGKAFLFL